MTTKCDPIFKMLRKHNLDKWDEECQVAFDKVKEYPTNAPILVPPVLGKPLILYLTIDERSMDASWGNTMKRDTKSKSYTTWARNSQIMSQSTHRWKRCVVHWHGQLKGLDNTCFTTLHGSLRGWIPSSISLRSLHCLEESQGGKFYYQNLTSFTCLRRSSKGVQ